MMSLCEDNHRKSRVAAPFEWIGDHVVEWIKLNTHVLAPYIHDIYIHYICNLHEAHSMRGFMSLDGWIWTLKFKTCVGTGYMWYVYVDMCWHYIYTLCVYENVLTVCIYMYMYMYMYIYICICICRHMLYVYVDACWHDIHIVCIYEHVLKIYI